MNDNPLDRYVPITDRMEVVRADWIIHTGFLTMPVSQEWVGKPAGELQEWDYLMKPVEPTF